MVNAAPAIQLSKGGGAIRGIDQKFTANAVTGTGSLSIPIPVTTSGRSDFSTAAFAPRMTQAPATARLVSGGECRFPQSRAKTDKGLPRYRDEDGSDTFILSESEDLVPLWKEQSGTWNKDAFEITVGAVEYAISAVSPQN